MIVKMKKVTILAPERQRQELLIRLRALGVVHIKNIKVPSADEIAVLKEDIDRADKALDILMRYSKAHPHLTVHREDVRTLDEAKEIVSLYREKEEKERSLLLIERQMEEFDPWGAFDPRQIRQLEAKGVSVVLYRAGRKAFKRMERPEGLYKISEDKHSVYLAYCFRGAGSELDLEKVTLPETDFGDLYNRQEALQKRIGDIESILISKTHAIGSIEEYLRTMRRRLLFLDVKHGMKEEKGFSYLQGFAPVYSINDIAGLSKNFGFGYIAEEADNPEETPTLIRNPAWIDIIRPVFKFMNTTPGYNEHDISLWFLIFLSIFFAMLIGDAGYGLIFAAAAFFIRMRFKMLPKEPFRLIYLFSFSTVVWGLITGTWFGYEGIARLGPLNSLVIEKIDSFSAGNETFMIYLCFVIGVVHLSIARLISAFRVINSLKALAEIGWVCMLWGLFFAAGTLVIGRPFPDLGGYLFAAGGALLLLFSNPQKNILKGMLVTLVSVPLKVISSFSDIVSYLRLFAVGYASVVMASSFNEMALGLGFNSVVTSLGSALILFFGHTLNIVLGLMAVIVHGIRLNMLEFSGQIGMEWSGIEYKPFCERTL